MRRERRARRTVPFASCDKLTFFWQVQHWSHWLAMSGTPRGLLRMQWQQERNVSLHDAGPLHRLSLSVVVYRKISRLTSGAVLG
jgi:hypothetical protein